MPYYDLRICGLTRRLPISHISKKTRLANFSILGDVELVNTLANQLAEKLKAYQFDYLVALEVKVVPLVHGVALRLNHQRFVLCRKSIKPYMVRPVVLKPMQHFPAHVKPLVLDGEDAQRLKGRKVVVVDTVISTGVTMRQARKLMEQVGAEVVLMVAILRQGKQFDKFKDLFYFEEIPIFQETAQNMS